MSFMWENISYLLDGNEKQRKVYTTLEKVKIFDILKSFNPILVGTIPIDIDTENSDLDIICEVYDFDEFEEVLSKNFKEMKEFKITIDKRKEIKNLVANFIYYGFIIEIFGQSLPTKKQNGYKHMIIEERLLKIGGDDFKREIIKLKKKE